MANLICTLTGARGRVLKLYDNKCEIITSVTFGSVVTGNATDGSKTIFYIDCGGIQFKESGLAIGFLQLETPSMQMNNQQSNFFSENTFTFEDGKNGITNHLMHDIYLYIQDRMEGYKYNDIELLENNLPQSLAKLYGKPRPLTAKEVQKIRDDKEAERIRISKEAEETQRNREALLKEALSTGSLDDVISSFLKEAQLCQRFSEVLATWKRLNLDTDNRFEEYTKELTAKTQIERMYGSSKEEVNQFVCSMGERLLK